ncbi:MAG: hypothetical protein V4619_13840 [Bacteroidota bacterium]
MKTFITCLLTVITLSVNAQQNMNTFYVVDSLTRKPLPSVTIAIVRAALSITTEKDGLFSIPGDLSTMRDTVVIYTQNYNSVKMPLANLQGIDTIKLEKMDMIAGSKLVFKNDTLLNDYNRFDVGNFAGLHMGNGEFKYLQIAQRFEAPKAVTVLKDVTIERLAFYLNKSKPGVINGQTEYSELEHTRFKLRVYDVNPVTGGPGKDLCDKVIEIKSRDDKKLATNLKRYNIVIPNKTFFIAIEWMRDYTNQGYVHINDKRGGVKGHTNYRPAIGLIPIKGEKLNIWVLNLNQQWGLYTYHSPDFTDLAVKATVGY